MLELHLADLVNCSCTTATDLGLSEYGNLIVNYNPKCYMHGLRLC